MSRQNTKRIGGTLLVRDATVRNFLCLGSILDLHGSAFSTDSFVLAIFVLLHVFTVIQSHLKLVV